MGAVSAVGYTMRKQKEERGGEVNEENSRWKVGETLVIVVHLKGT